MLKRPKPVLMPSGNYGAIGAICSRDAHPRPRTYTSTQLSPHGYTHVRYMHAQKTFAAVHVCTHAHIRMRDFLTGICRCLQVSTQMSTHTRARIHTHTIAHVYTHVCTHAGTHVYTHVCTHVCLHTHLSTHTSTHMSTHMPMHPSTHTSAYTSAHTSYTHIHASSPHVYTYAYTYVHKYAYITYLRTLLYTYVHATSPLSNRASTTARPSTTARRASSLNRTYTRVRLSHLRARRTFADVGCCRYGLVRSIQHTHRECSAVYRIASQRSAAQRSAAH